MRGGPLVEQHQLVRLVGLQAVLAGQGLQPVPLAPALGHVRVEVHRRSVAGIVLTVRVQPDRQPTRDAVLVNGEAVEVDVRYARLGSRALALLLDIGVQLVLVIFLMLLVVLVVTPAFGTLADEAFLRSAFVIVLVTVFIAYPTVMETLTNGRSLGKRALGLRVVREDGGPIRVRHALTRTLVGLAIEWPGLIMPLVTWVVSMLTMIFSPRGRRLGDRARGPVGGAGRTPRCRRSRAPRRRARSGRERPRICPVPGAPGLVCRR